MFETWLDVRRCWSVDVFGTRMKQGFRNKGFTTKFSDFRNKIFGTRILEHHFPWKILIYGRSYRWLHRIYHCISAYAPHLSLYISLCTASITVYQPIVSYTMFTRCSILHKHKLKLVAWNILHEYCACHEITCVKVLAWSMMYEASRSSVWSCLHVFRGLIDSESVCFKSSAVTYLDPFHSEFCRRLCAGLAQPKRSRPLWNWRM
jgi:hypothetical protein